MQRSSLCRHFFGVLILTYAYINQHVKVQSLMQTSLFHLDKSPLTFLQLPYSLRIPECSVEAAIGLPFIPLSHARNAQHEEVHYLYIRSPPATPRHAAQNHISTANTGEPSECSASLKTKPRLTELRLTNATD